MEKIKEYKGIIIMVLIILGITFYWFQWRPMQIKKECRRISLERLNIITLENQNQYNLIYKLCSQSHGL